MTTLLNVSNTTHKELVRRVESCTLLKMAFLDTLGELPDAGHEIVDLWINRLTVEPDGTIRVNYQKKYRNGIKIVFDGILSIYKTDAGKTFYGEQSMCLDSYYWKTRHLVKHAEVSDIVVDFNLQ